MKIRMIPENKLYAGMPKDIVKKMANDAIFLKARNSEDYMQTVINRLPSVQLEGCTDDERCESFLKGLLQIGAAEIVTDSSSL